MPNRSSLRASDADRERIVDALRKAAGEGRLAVHELEERIGRALKAKTYGELDPLVRDLPVDRDSRRRPGKLTLARRYPVAAMAIAVVAIVAVVVLATMAAFASGVWVIAVAGFFVLRGRGARRNRDFGERRGHMHAHRW